MIIKIEMAVNSDELYFESDDAALYHFKMAYLTK